MTDPTTPRHASDPTTVSAEGGGPGTALMPAPGAAIAAPLSAFDFDGTMTRCDTFMPFLRALRGRWGFWSGIARSIPVILAFLLGRMDRGAAKAETLKRICDGATRADFETASQRFAREALPRLIRPEAAAQMAQDRAEGYVTGIVSASPEIYLTDCATALGADYCIATRLAWDGTGSVTGIEGENCYGPEKMRRLGEAFPGADHRLARAYGDSKGDAALLAAAARSRYKPFHGTADALRSRLIYIWWLL